MENVLYEYSYKFDLMLLIPFFMFAFIAAYPFLQSKFGKYDFFNKIDFKTTFGKVFRIIFLVFTGLMSVLILFSEISSYKECSSAYKIGDYQTVEGYVENFKPAQIDSEMESFEINGVKFEYSDRVISPGYNQTAYYGGVINSNGQHLKIGYIDGFEDGEKYILYIEQIE